MVAPYEEWPYPVWRRITTPVPRRLPEVLRKFSPADDAIPVEADVLVAGCGSGRQAAAVALEYLDANVTAIDVSEASLEHARRQCAAVGAPAIRFHQLDLHDASELDKQFDAIFCGGVVHHLPGPEAGWAVLNTQLKPGGVMKIAVYSRIARVVVQDVRSFLRDLLDEPVSDDLLRRVRHRVLTHSNPPAHPTILNAADVSTLAGTRDLLLHSHEDPFDVPRIAQALDRLGLRLLSLALPTPMAEVRYSAMFPDDPLHRDFGS